MGKRQTGRQPALKDWHLWSELTRNVSPLRPGASRIPMRRGAVVAPPAEKPDGSTDAMHPEPARPQALGKVLGKAQHGSVPSRQPLDPRLRRRLSRGQMPIDATLDLHGLTQAEARRALERFLPARAARGDRTILVITGKGLQRRGEDGAPRGVLRAMLPNWLGQGELAGLVAGWEAAAPAHGGEGAFYIRLKRAGR